MNIAIHQKQELPDLLLIVLKPLKWHAKFSSLKT